MARCRPFREDFGETGWLGRVGKALNQIGRALNLLTLDGQPYEYAAGAIKLTSLGGVSVSASEPWDLIGINRATGEITVRGGRVEIHHRSATRRFVVADTMVTAEQDGIAYIFAEYSIDDANLYIKLQTDTEPESDNNNYRVLLWSVNAEWSDDAQVWALSSWLRQKRGNLEFVGWRDVAND